MSESGERFLAVHTLKSDDQDDNSLSSTRDFSPDEVAVVPPKEKPISDPIPVRDSNYRESHCTTSFSSSQSRSYEPHLLQSLRHSVSSILNIFSTLIALNVDCDLRFDRLQEKGRLRIEIDGKEGSSGMATNEQCLLYCPPKRLCVIDDQGVEN